MRFRLISVVICASVLLLFCSTALSFDVNSFASGIQQKNTPEQWIQKNKIPNYDESRLSNPQSLEDSEKAQKFMDLAAQMTSSQYSYTCSMIRKVEDKSFFKCDADGSIYNSMALCTANCKSTFACNQEQCLYQNMCSSFQTCPLGDYPCTNNSCTQIGTCSSTQVTTTQYQCPTTGQTYTDQTTCNNNCLQTASCTETWTQCTLSTSFGNCIASPGGSCTVTGQYSIVYYSDTSCNFPRSNAYDISDGGLVSGAGSVQCPPGYQCSFHGTNYEGEVYNISTLTYTCPLGSQYSCSGSPPICTAGTTCTTQNVTTTKYQCSFTGMQYDTESQCTSACLNTASCNTNYKCTYENSTYSDASTCQANCSFYQCPSDGAYYLTAPECQNACASFICSRDGVKYTSQYDCQANCKEAGTCTAQ